MRPISFPSIRLAQLAALYYRHPDLHAKILAANEVHDIRRLFEVSASSYWDTHFLFDRDSHICMSKQLGKSTIESIIINGIVPFLFAFGQYRADDSMVEKAIYFLESLSSERNSIIKEWKKYQVIPENAFQSQGLIQLKKHYCDQKRCLECAFGHKVLKSMSDQVKEERV